MTTTGYLSTKQKHQQHVGVSVVGTVGLLVVVFLGECCKNYPVVAFQNQRISHLLSSQFVPWGITRTKSNKLFHHQTSWSLNLDSNNNIHETDTDEQEKFPSIPSNSPFFSEKNVTNKVLDSVSKPPSSSLYASLASLASTTSKLTDATTLGKSSNKDSNVAPYFSTPLNDNPIIKTTSDETMTTDFLYASLSTRNSSNKPKAIFTPMSTTNSTASTNVTSKLPFGVSSKNTTATTLKSSSSSSFASFGVPKDATNTVKQPFTMAFPQANFSVPAKSSTSTFSYSKAAATSERKNESKVSLPSTTSFPNVEQSTTSGNPNITATTLPFPNSPTSFPFIPKTAAKTSSFPSTAKSITSPFPSATSDPFNVNTTKTVANPTSSNTTKSSVAPFPPISTKTPKNPFDNNNNNNNNVSSIRSTAFNIPTTSASAFPTITANKTTAATPIHPSSVSSKSGNGSEFSYASLASLSKKSSDSKTSVPKESPTATATESEPVVSSSSTTLDTKDIQKEQRKNNANIPTPSSAHKEDTPKPAVVSSSSSSSSPMSLKQVESSVINESTMLKDVDKLKTRFGVPPSFSAAAPMSTNSPMSTRADKEETSKPIVGPSSSTPIPPKPVESSVTKDSTMSNDVDSTTTRFGVPPPSSSAETMHTDIPISASVDKEETPKPAVIPFSSSTIPPRPVDLSVTKESILSNDVDSINPLRVPSPPVSAAAETKNTDIPISSSADKEGMPKPAAVPFSSSTIPPKPVESSVAEESKRSNEVDSTTRLRVPPLPVSTGAVTQNTDFLSSSIVDEGGMPQPAAVPLSSSPIPPKPIESSVTNESTRSSEVDSTTRSRVPPPPVSTTTAATKNTDIPISSNADEGKPAAVPFSSSPIPPKPVESSFTKESTRSNEVDSTTLSTIPPPPASFVTPSTARDASTSPPTMPKAPTSFSSSTRVTYDQGRVLDVSSTSTPAAEDNDHDEEEAAGEYLDMDIGPSFASGPVKRDDVKRNIPKTKSSSSSPSKPISVTELWEITGATSTREITTEDEDSTRGINGRSSTPWKGVGKDSRSVFGIDAEVLMPVSPPSSSSMGDASKSSSRSSSVYNVDDAVVDVLEDGEEYEDYDGWEEDDDLVDFNRPVREERAVIFDNTAANEDDEEGFDDYYGRPSRYYEEIEEYEDVDEFNFAFAPRGEGDDFLDEYDEEEEDLDEGYWEDEYDEYDGEDVANGYWEDPPLMDEYDDEDEFEEYEDDSVDVDDDEEEENEEVVGPFVISDPPQAPENFGAAVAAAAMAKTGGPIPDSAFMTPEVQKQLSQNPAMNVVSSSSTTRQSPLNDNDVPTVAQRHPMHGSVVTGNMMTPKIRMPPQSTVSSSGTNESIAQSRRPPPPGPPGAPLRRKNFQVGGSAPPTFGSAVAEAAAGMGVGNISGQPNPNTEGLDLVDDVAMKFYRRTWKQPPPE